ncbi:universal stress protein [Actinomadura rugatobispora]|uniref:Universal stress protein n=1 Tax=Actinomadura rugatobispora TaxID=1994 RepID=A0ABW1A4Z9_9ACTN|nr:universal stress protein [Actinomadura rugatobispora]
MYPSVLVGYEGTKEGERALRWAVEEARLRRSQLVVCHCWRWPYPIGHVDLDLEETVKRMGLHVLERGVHQARELAPSLRIQKRLADGPAYAALMHESYEAELVVIGSHEQGSPLIGSTVLQLPGRAHVPVVTVRPAEPVHGRVMVGVDGSAGSDAALAFAFEEAALRGWRLEAVHGCWEPGAVAGSDLALFADHEELERSCGALLQRAVAAWRHKYPRVEVDTSLIMEGPRTALLRAAERADLAVVGDRGTGTVRSLVLGATSTALLQHSPCTVAVTPSVGRA